MAETVRNERLDILLLSMVLPPFYDHLIRQTVLYTSFGDEKVYQAIKRS
jgi:hypothetical protein